MTCWEPIIQPLAGVVARQLGPLTVHACRVDDEWHVALTYESPAAARGPEPPAAELGWQRWVVSDGSGGLRLTPAMPDRAVVVRPNFPLSLEVGEAALLHVTVPAWLRLTAEPAAAVLLDVPTVLLSKIWYGDVTAGELCYSIKTRATRRLDSQPEVPWRVTCPVRVSNRSARSLLLERLCVHAQHLAIFAGGGRLWTPEVQAVFSGADQVAEVVYGKDPPAECPAPTLCSAARSPAPTDLFWRAFRELAQINLF